MPENNTHSNELINLLNEESVRAVFDNFYQPLNCFANNLLSDVNEAEDVVAGTFVKLLEKSLHFKNLHQLKSFLYTSVKNACVDILRKREARNRYLNTISGDKYEIEILADEEMLKSRVWQHLYMEIEALPHQCKQIFKEIFIQKKDTAIIARELGISRQTVLNQKSRAIHLLRIRLQKGFDNASLVFTLLMFMLSRHE